MYTIAGSTELTMLAWGIALALVQIVLQAMLCSLDVGLPYAVGSQDGGLTEKGAVAGRSRRALRNMLETFPLFAALALAVVASNKAGGLAATGATLWFWARVVYVPIYLAGIPVLRTVVWGASIAGLVMMLVKLLG
jgi:uncharacterized MAPEG superfamily protein